MIGRKVAAALAAGCTCVLKPAEDTPLTALAFAKVCEEAGVPAGALNVLPCSRSRVQSVGAALCDSPKVQALSFTGSTAVGRVSGRGCQWAGFEWVETLWAWFEWAVLLYAWFEWVESLWAWVSVGWVAWAWVAVGVSISERCLCRWGVSGRGLNGRGLTGR
ncbi:Succinate-semialdehyde dehydrogenase, mitochondrial [Penaeus vannamei]|uniref:Succinate-semialdehyde dehydrogenase, mitochondrial n=1 Tax=Penaeus vannamei TaxID=6689 RepID=A0A3R7LQ87_PENVA|nr:Succinate-semialdehyde dehydrogenase, mitochondrial [Penaeus vannamei]